MKESVLIMGDDVRSFLTVVRSLGSKGIVVDVCPINFSSHALHSRYIRRIHRLTPYSLDKKRWVNSLRKIIKKNQYNLIIPCNDQFIIPIYEHIGELPKCNMALPNRMAYEYFYDKFSTRSLADRCNVPMAPGRLLKDNDSGETLISEFGLPLIIKPRRSFNIDTLDTRNKVHVLKSQNAIDSLLKILKKPSDYMVEGYFSGQGGGISILADKGTVLLAFQHIRIHEPPDGGGSSYRKSVQLDPVLEGYVLKLARETNLSGVCMFEFKINKAKETAILIEVNARFWGSLPLAVWSGVDFPYYLFRLLVHGNRPKITRYKVGCYSRNLTSDLFCLAAHLESGQARRILVLFRLVRGLVIGFMRFVSGKEKIDSFSWKDPAPSILEFTEILRLIGRKILKFVPYYNSFLRNHTAKRLLKIWRRSRHRSTKIAVICSGNICRSPFAAQLIRRRLNEIGATADIQSYGLIPRNYRKPPADAIECARRFNVDISDHYSMYATDKVLIEAHIIFVFDDENKANIKARSLANVAPVVKLGDLCGIGTIPDPYGCGQREFNLTYDAISRCVEKIVEVLSVS